METGTPDPGEYAFLKRAALFRSLPEEMIRMIFMSGELIGCGPSHVIFSEGAPGFDLYVVKSGVVEVRKESRPGQPRVVGYLSTGECVGEMSLVTGLPRSATVRVPERAEVFKIPGSKFEQLLTEHAMVALSLAKILAYRLQIANQLHISESAPAKHLAGDLEYFDLAEVCQALIQGRRTGVMLVRTLAGEGMLYFDEGNIGHAKIGMFRGREAILYVFRARLKGQFEFHSTEAYAGPTDEPPIEENPMSYILEAIRQRDEIDAMRSVLPGPDHVFTALAPSWGPVAAGDAQESRRNWAPRSEEDNQLAREVWDAIQRGWSFGRIVKEHLADEHAVFSFVDTLVRMGRVR